MSNKPIRFRVDYEKCIEGIDLLAQEKPGITQYYVCKVFFFADKEHLLDWGRPISGDRFVAMEHGPVPSFIYDLLKDSAAEPDEIVDQLNARINILRDQNRLMVYSKGSNSFPHLSGTDREYLLSALCTYGDMPFGKLRDLSHQDIAYQEAWELSGSNNEMDIRRWFSGVDWSGSPAIQQLQELSQLSDLSGRPYPAGCPTFAQDRSNRHSCDESARQRRRRCKYACAEWC